MAVLFLILQLVLFGGVVTYFFQLRFYIEERIVAGLLIGIVWFGYVMFGLSMLFGLGSNSMFVFLILNTLFVILMFSTNVVSQFRNDIDNFSKRLKETSWIYFWIAIIFFCVFLSYEASYLLTSKDSQLYVQPLHAYGDISWHLSLINSFAFGANFPPQSPILVGMPVSYPFMVDFITAIFINPLGIGVHDAVSITGILLIICLVFIVSYFVLHITSSKVAAILTLLFFIFNGGLGFLIFLEDFKLSEKPLWDFLISLTKDYTALKESGFWWINVVLSMLLPQRSFLLGFPVAILILRLFWDLHKELNFKLFVLGIILASLLPLIHTHTLIAISIFMAWLTIKFLLKDIKQLNKTFVVGLIGVIVALTLSSLFLQQAHSIDKILSFHMGWINKGENVLFFYIKNFGIILFLVPITLFLGLKQRLTVAYFALIGQVWFVLPSFFIFQPWDFDNIKLFIYWYFVSVVLVGYFVSKLLQSRVLEKVIAGFAIIFLMIFSGVIDHSRLISGSGTQYEVYSTKAIRVASFIKQETPKDSVFLTVDKFDNPAIALAGRKAVLGYKTWAWSYGLDYSQREQDLSVMLSGSDNELFNKYNISYAIFFDQQTDYQINRDYFMNNFKLIYDQDGYEIYKIK